MVGSLDAAETLMIRWWVEVIEDRYPFWVGAREFFATSKQVGKLTHRISAHAGTVWPAELPIGPELCTIRHEFPCGKVSYRGSLRLWYQRKREHAEWKERRAIIDVPWQGFNARNCLLEVRNSILDCHGDSLVRWQIYSSEKKQRRQQHF